MTKSKTTPMTVKTIKVNSSRNSFFTQVEKVTTVHGTGRFSSMRGGRLVLWSAIMLGNVALTGFFLYVIRQKFNENQIVTQVNANCKVSQVPFPAVSICTFNLVSLKESANIAKILEKRNIPQKDIEDFFNSLHYLISFNKNSVILGNFTYIMNILKKHYFTMDTIMEELHQTCESLLLYCTFNRKPKKCEEIFTLTKTVEGYCCAFNYVGLNDPAEVSMLQMDDDLEYYDYQTDDNSRNRIVMTSESGSNTGLSVVLNFEPNDYPSWSTIPYYGAKILISDPADYPETSILYRYITLGEWVEIKVEAELFQSSSELRRVSPEKRNCWFFDEVLLEHTDRYSYETCNSECRMNYYMQSCGCIPFQYPRDKSTRVCELEDVKCLNNVTMHVSTRDMNCTCFIECQDKRFMITSDLAPFVAEEFPPNVTSNRNSSELAVLQVYHGKSNLNCYKKSLLIDMNYFIATYGGVFSLSFGASILTVFEFSFTFFSAIAKPIWRRITYVYKNLE